MTDIPLYQRKALPPARTGRLPRNIPVESGLKRFGQALTKFSGDIYDDIVKSRATNEIAEFQGLANTEIEAVDTFVAANPNLPFEEYEKRIDKAILNIKVDSEKPTTREGKAGASVWMLRNLDLVKQRMLTSAEAELSKQELRRSEVLIENFKVNLNYEGLTDHYARMVAAGTYDEETIFGTIIDGKPVGGRLELELKAMKAAEQKLAVDNAVGTAFAVWEATITKENPDGDLRLALDSVEENPNVPAGDKQEVESEAQTRIKNRQAINKEERKEATSEANKQLTDLAADRKLTVDEIKVRRDILSDTEYKNWMKAAAAPLDIKLNYPEYDKVIDIIDGVAADTHTQEEAEAAINKGVGKYFDAEEAKRLRTKLSTNLKPGSPTKRPAVTRALTAVEEIYDLYIESQDDLTVEEQAALLQKKHRLKNDLEAWALEEDRTDKEIEEKVKLLTRIPKEEIVTGWLERFIIGTGGRGFPIGKAKRGKEDFGNRPDGTPKGTGFLGVLPIKNGGVTTEFSTQSNAVKVNGKRIDFPTLVPTLTQKEVDLMTEDIIPNNKPIPEPIMQKAIAHAKQRIKQGKSVFAGDDILIINTQEEYDALPKGARYEDADGNRGIKQ